MARLYPLASDERLHDVCDAIDLWLHHLRSAELASQLRALANKTESEELASRYFRWALALERGS